MNKIVCRTCGRVSYGRLPANYCNARCRIRSPEYIERNRARLEQRRRRQGRKRVKGRRICVVVHKRYCTLCGTGFWTASAVKQVRCNQCTGIVSLCRAGLIVKQCRRCAGSFKPQATRGRASDYCSDDCLRAAKKDNANRYRRERRRKHGNRSTYRKRARRAGAEYEPVSVQKVMDRDGWRCQICGRRTPKNLRGTCKPNAPELDHIIPFAMGGPHTYSNVQCACRACNAAKGGTQVVGQMGLFGVAA
jgi:hypothetical protein